jgi:hypothetical protein
MRRSRGLGDVYKRQALACGDGCQSGECNAARNVERIALVASPLQ